MSARLLFIGLLNFSDDNGNLVNSPKRLKMQIFPADSIDCAPLISELIAHGVLTEYVVNDIRYLNIKGFKKHQVINRPSRTEIPEPNFNDDSLSAHGVIRDGREGKGKEKEKIQKENPDFEEFWKLFPKKRAGNPEKAEAAYRQALKRSTAEQILSGLKSYVDSDEVRQGFAKGAAAWLNDNRWSSDYSSPTTCNAKQPKMKNVIQL